LSCSRRQLLQGGAAAAALAALGVRPAWGEGVSIGGVIPQEGLYAPLGDSLAERADPDVMKKLAMEAINAAKDAGAQYADVRLTRSVSQRFFIGSTLITGANVIDMQYVAVGVRVLINNAWGFASSPFWRMKEMSILAKNAVEQAKANSVGAKQPVEMGKVPPATGDWTMPIRVDPFTIPIEERIDFMTSWMEFASNFRRGVNHGMSQMHFKRQERAVATTDGVLVTQTLYETSGEFSINVTTQDWRTSKSMSVNATGLTPAGAGWELFLDAKIPDQIPTLVAHADELLSIPTRRINVGRYDLVMDADSVAQLMGATIGAATELDRAMGLEANASGTSYLSPPLDVLKRGGLIASPLVTITGNRSMPQGVATVKWDDEGVEPDTFTIVRKGVLVDFQTTREQAAWLAPWYKAQNLPIRSHGCAASDSAMHFPILHSPNMELQPSASDIGLDELVADTSRGLAVFGGSVAMDYQGSSGTGSAPIIREIVNGKLGALVAGVSYQVTGNMWRMLTSLGGPHSVKRLAYSRFKGEPLQGTTHSILAVPAKFRNVSVFDAMRRA
jgi:TldD protein